MTRAALAARVAGAVLAAASFSLSIPATADPLKIGMITTLSGPGAGLGIDIRDGFQLGLAHVGGALGGLETEVIEGDDGRRPDVAVQLAARMIERDGARIITGIVWSDVALAVMPTVVRNRAFFVSANAGPSQLAGRRCSPYYFNVAWQNDNNHEAIGQYVQDQGFNNVYLMAANYPAGKDGVAGFRRFYKGGVAAEVYPPLGQLDFAAELTQVRAANPDAVFIFFPGGQGISFIKQYQQAGLKETIPLFGSAFSFSQDVLAAVGDAALGIKNTAQWSPDLENPVNQRFVAEFKETYGRIPSLYASQGYDAALLMDAALRDAGGVEDEEALRAALKAADFQSVRGEFRFNDNHFPIQDFYLREVVQLEDGTYTNRLLGEAFEDHADAYAGECSLR